MEDTDFDLQYFDLLLLGVIEIMKFGLQIVDQYLVIFDILLMS